ncbi:MAG: indolepyruvate ferredoxin oxidoreductase family protein, partial [Chitinophagaceae bacterium]|nr:indolepyruvate ferredoxin oxidoreductase family protein [Anaerolineae bacterium]
MLTEKNIFANPPRQNTSNLIETTFTLEDKYTKEEGWILLSGIQAIVRLPLDQHRADKKRGLNTATLVSGYRGSPLGGLDITIQQSDRIMQENQVHLLPAINEELGATAIFGSQIANMLPNPKYDGVLGMWYGKAPGVDRSGDIFKHANFAGVGRNGGVLALAGDDPISKSSTLPSHSEVALYDALFPILYPGSTQDILDLGRLGFELSRFSGLWVGFKIVTNVADEFSTAQISPDRVIIETPEFSYNGKPWHHNQSTRLLTPYSLAMEREIHDGRLEAAKLFAAANGINCITVPTPNAWLGIVTAGKTYYDVRQALHELGLDEEQLRHYGIRLLKIGMLFPMETQIIHEFAQGLDEILVIEEKRAFMELFIRDILYHRSERPNIVGKRDEYENMLISPHGELDVDKIAQIVAKRISQRITLDSIQARIQQIQAPTDILTVPLLSRSPFFCSGCPHNSSTVLPEGSLAGAGIGCHTMTLLSGSETTIGLTQMGGEGVQWVGASQFSNVNHMFQNLGDGTLFHSGSLAIRQSIAAKVNITYKILYNSAVAMTGGQDADGAMPVPELTLALKAEGVGKIIVTSDEPDKYAEGTKWADGVEIWHRDRLDEAQRVLREIPGVTVLIHDQECAAELRRKRKRGLAPEPETRVFINEAVCEGCGDCGVKSNCLSVFPVETEFGRKTQIHQSSCNKDYSCLKGDCPAFITVIPGEKAVQREYDINTDLPEPDYHFTGE